METALYFPYMQVPETTWLTQVVLYWDAVGVIVPRSVRHDGSVVSRYMHELHKVGLLDYVEPDRELAEGYDLFVEGFLALVDGVPQPAGSSLAFQQIHADKMSARILDQLAGRGLALQDPGHDCEWWSVESSTAELYLSYMAGALCARRSQGEVVAHPVSDRLGALAGFSATRQSHAERLRELRCAVIMDALPVPGRVVAPAEIRRFKDGHAGQLSGLRRQLDQRLHDVVALDNPDEREWRAKLTIDELRDEVEALREPMANRRWPEVVFLGLAGATSAANGPAPLAYAALAPHL